MKKALLIIAIVFAATMANAQDPLSFDYVIQKEGASAEQIYSALVDWIATNFKAVDGDFYRDKEEKMVTKDVVFDFSTGKLTMICYDGKVSYKLKLQCRDGRFKVELTNFNHRVNPGNNESCALGLIPADAGQMNYKSYEEKAWQKIKEACEAEADRMKRNLEALTIKPSNDDW